MLMIIWMLLVVMMMTVMITMAIPAQVLLVQAVYPVLTGGLPLLPGDGDPGAPQRPPVLAPGDGQGGGGRQGPALQRHQAAQAGRHHLGQGDDRRGQEAQGGRRGGHYAEVLGPGVADVVAFRHRAGHNVQVGSCAHLPAGAGPVVGGRGPGLGPAGQPHLLPQPRLQGGGRHHQHRAVVQADPRLSPALPDLAVCPALHHHVLQAPVGRLDSQDAASTSFLDPSSNPPLQGL